MPSTTSPEAVDKIKACTGSTRRGRFDPPPLESPHLCRQGQYRLQSSRNCLKRLGGPPPPLTSSPAVPSGPARRRNPPEDLQLPGRVQPVRARKSAPVLVLSVAKKVFTSNGKPNAYGMHDTGAASANLALQATSDWTANSIHGGLRSRTGPGILCYSFRRRDRRGHRNRISRRSGQLARAPAKDGSISATEEAS